MPVCQGPIYTPLRMGRCDDVTPADFIREFWLAAEKSVQPENSACGHWSNGSEGLFCPAISTGRRNTLIFLERWSDEHEVSPPRIFTDKQRRKFGSDGNEASR
jgi:hypothetical protein